MAGAWRTERLPVIVRALAARPRHEALRGLIAEILREAFAVTDAELSHEVYTVHGRGRIDAMFGATVIEFKSDLRTEIADVVRRMPDYLAEAARRTGRAASGLATDGADFIAYEMRGGVLQELARYKTKPDRPEELLGWLEPMLSARTGITPEPWAVEQAFGRNSLPFARAAAMLDALWAALRDDPEVALKRGLWDGLLSQAYGAPVGEDTLFLQHTYLTIVVKAIAAEVLDLRAAAPEALLSGRALTDAGIFGAVEADFFDWPLRLPEGAALVRLLVAEAARFRLRDAQADVLKALYESLIDPAQRHDLGEYYTPDWLAARVVAASVASPLTDRVLDPACGSGTFLFHALRHLIAAGQAAKWTSGRILRACAAQVRGLDVHPVAVTIARVTWLLALGKLALERDGPLHVPVFLGDGLQWNVVDLVDRRDVEVAVPNDRPLRIPQGFAEDQARFDAGLSALRTGLDQDQTPGEVGRALARIPDAAAADVAALEGTFGQLQALYRAGRDGIWPFVFRNLVRPLWLSRPDQRADVVVGNPPWIAYRHLSPAMKDALRIASRAYGLWVGGNLATQQDICALFWARAAERYLRDGGVIAFVLPWAVLNAPAFAGLRAGAMRTVQVRITAAWSLESVRPVFGGATGAGTTSTCVLFGMRADAGPLPARVERLSGNLPRRDANDFEAELALVRARAPWPEARVLAGASPYRERFRDGATIYPRRFFLVERDDAGRLGSRRDAPRVRGRTGSQDKRPWRDVEPPAGPVELAFLRPLCLGETILPYRLLDPPLAVIPMDGAQILDARAARDAGHAGLAAWLRDVEAKWEARCNRGTDGLPRMTLTQQIDHIGKLRSQAEPSEFRMVYTKAGTRLSACLLTDARALVDHQAYWIAARSEAEGRCLAAIINSEAVLDRVRALQPRGSMGARHFDKLVWTLPIPEYDEALALHRELAGAAVRAADVAARVDLGAFNHFTAKRRAIRTALSADGVAALIETLVARLLGG